MQRFAAYLVNLFIVIILILSFIILNSNDCIANQININSATFEELLEISELNEVIAAKIIKYRKDNGSFKTIYDILKVDGMTGELFEKIKDKITITSNTNINNLQKKLNQTNQSSNINMNKINEANKITETESSDNTLFDEGRRTSVTKSSTSKQSKVTRISDDIKKIPLNSENYYKVIIGLMRLAKYDKAKTSILDFIKQFPNDKYTDDMNYLLGACYEEEEKYEEAINYYQKVYENQNSKLRGIALFRIGICYDLLGKPTLALDNYRKYIASFPNSAFVKEAENRIEEMLGNK